MVKLLEDQVPAAGRQPGVQVVQPGGQRREGEEDGPEELHVVLLDNGRSRLLADPELREALEQVRMDDYAGPFDEGFFMYSEELDLCRRIKAAGWEIASHGLKWIEYKDFSESDERAHMADAIRLHTEVVGEPPRCKWPRVSERVSLPVIARISVATHSPMPPRITSSRPSSPLPLDIISPPLANAPSATTTIE